MVLGWTARLLLVGVVGITGATVATPPARGTPPAGAAVTTSVTQYGVTLTLTVPGRAYPANALVPTTLRLTNVSTHPIRTNDCLRSSLFTAAVKPGAPFGFRPLYPPLLPPPGAPWSDCPGDQYQPKFVPNATILTPGQSITVRRDVVLRSFQIRGMAYLQTARLAKAAIVQTPLIVLRQVSGLSGPRVTLRYRPEVEALVRPVTGAGPILTSSWVECAHSVRERASFSEWTKAKGTVLDPLPAPCARLMEWTLFVAQPGRPVAQVEYCPQHDRCDYAPPTPQDQGIAACKRGVVAAAQAGKFPHNADVIRYAVGITSSLPPGARLTAAQRTLANQWHARCYPLLHHGR